VSPVHLREQDDQAAIIGYVVTSVGPHPYFFDQKSFLTKAHKEYGRASLAKKSVRVADST
jgi:hypothetical protein